MIDLRHGVPFGLAVSELLLQLVLRVLAVQQLQVCLIQLSLEVRLALLQLLMQSQQICIPTAHS